MKFANSPLGSSCVVVALIENYSTSNPLKVSPEKSHILSCDTVVANERYVLHELAWPVPVSYVPKPVSILFGLC